MKQILMPFKENMDIPESHLYALRVCNSGGAWAFRSSFYKLKTQILEKYGHEADYDLQTIKKKCYTCNGTGQHRSGNACWNCTNGIYQTKKVVLKRFLINAAIFHNPVGELFAGKLKIFTGYYEDDYYCQEFPMFRSEEFNGRIVGEINGLIKHEPLALHPIWAYYYLLWHYDQTGFYKRIASDVKNYSTNTQYKLKKLLNKFNPLKAYAEFFEVKKEQLEPIDDLPF